MHSDKPPVLPKDNTKSATKLKRPPPRKYRGVILRGPLGVGPNPTAKLLRRQIDAQKWIESYPVQPERYRIYRITDRALLSEHYREGNKWYTKHRAMRSDIRPARKELGEKWGLDRALSLEELGKLVGVTRDPLRMMLKWQQNPTLLPVSVRDRIEKLLHRRLKNWRLKLGIRRPRDVPRETSSEDTPYRIQIGGPHSPTGRRPEDIAQAYREIREADIISSEDTPYRIQIGGPHKRRPGDESY